MFASLIALTLGTAATPFVSSLEAVSTPGNLRTWERWTFNVTNTEDADRDIRICPNDVTMTLNDPANSQTNAFAIAFDKSGWSHDCTATTLGAGESVSLKVYIRRFGEPGVSRTVTLETADGGYIAPLS